MIALCENTFEEWAKADPTRLLAFLVDPASLPHHLTFAAEIAGRDVGAAAIPALIALLAHPPAAAQEGAIAGLAWHLSDPCVVRALETAVNDPVFPHPEIQALAREALAEAGGV